MNKPCRDVLMLVASTVGFAAAAGFTVTAPAVAAETRPPNIVFIFGDDSGIDTYGCYGSDRFKNMTPNLDALAGSGTRFERCYAMPVCGPSRCVLMTGRYGFRTGGMSNQSAPDPS